jgi:thiosulfate reductase cytochrome b subunit
MLELLFDLWDALSSAAEVSSFLTLLLLLQLLLFVLISVVDDTIVDESLPLLLP